MKIELGRLACSGIEAHLGGNVEAAVSMALLRYADRLKSGPAPIALPGFCRDQENQQDAEVVLDLAVDLECQTLLERDAARQGTTTSHLVAHAVLIYLAELESLASEQVTVGHSGV